MIRHGYIVGTLSSCDQILGHPAGVQSLIYSHYSGIFLFLTSQIPQFFESNHIYFALILSHISGEHSGTGSLGAYFYTVWGEKGCKQIALFRMQSSPCINHTYYSYKQDLQQKFCRLLQPPPPNHPPVQASSSTMGYLNPLQAHPQSKENHVGPRMMY